jgi:hypothetical protein
MGISESKKRLPFRVGGLLRQPMAIDNQDVSW